MRRSALAALLPAVLLLATQPFAAAPVNDDWQTYLSAFRFAETGALRIPDYSAMGMVGWTALGGAVAALTGSGFVGLRLLTMACHAASGWMAYRAAREWGIDGRRALLASLVVSTSPVLFWLATSYMTDAPWHAAWVGAIWAWSRACRTGRARWFVAGGAAAAWAAWVRLPAAALPMALAFVAWRSLPDPGARRRAWIAAGATFLAGPVAFALWYGLVHGATQAFGSKAGTDAATALRLLPGGIFASVTYLGLFLLPVAPLALPGRMTRGAVAAAAAAACVALVHAKTGFLGIAVGKSFPCLPNVLFNAGVGPLTVTDVLREGGAPPVRAPGAAAVALQVGLAALGAALAWTLVRAAFARGAGPERRLVAVAAVLVAGAALLFSRPHAPLFDRYLVPLLLPGALLLLRTGGAASPGAFRAAAGLAAAVALVAVAGTRDYHRFAAARERLTDAALATGTPPRRIDAGFEFGGFRNSEAARAGEFARDPAWKGWWVERPDVVVATRPREGYSVVRREPVVSLLGARTWDLLLLERER